MQTETVAGWEAISLGTLCELVNGHAFKPTEWRSLGKPIIRIQNLNGGADYNFYQGILPSQYEVSPGTLLFAWSGNRGTSFGPYIWQGPTGLLNQHIFKVIPKEGVDQLWLFYALDEVRQRVERDAHGASGLVHVKKEDLCNYRVSKPNPLEQQGIATVLDTMDETIRRTEAVLAKLRQVKAGMLHDLLTLGLDENGELRDPIRHPEQFKDSPLGRIPKSWDITPLGFIIQMLKTGVSVNAWGRPTSGELPGVLKTSCVHSGLFLPEENKTVFQRDIYRVSCPVKADSIIISRMNTPFLVGESGYVDADFPYLFLPDRLWITEMRTERVTSVKWLSYVLNWEPVRKKIRDIATGTSGSMKNISQNDFLSIEIITPNPSEQKDIANRLSSIDKLLGRETNLLSKLVKQKQGLMHDLLTGRGRVSRLLEAMP